MAATDFIASLVSSLAWPAVLIAILVIFRRQFGTMLDRLSRMKLGSGGQNAESDWQRTQDTVRQSLSSSRRTAIAGAREPAAMAAAPQQGSRAVSNGPLALIDDRWAALETELRGVIKPTGRLSDGELAAADFDALLDVALRSGLLDAAAVRSLDGLRHLRNLARADDHLTAKSAEDFAVMADAICYAMRSQSAAPSPAG